MTKADEKILSVIQKHRMISDGDTVIVAVSGGADSMCLLHFFNSISIEKNLNIICAHVNHGIRGEEALRDENFVKSFCHKHSIRFECAHYNVPILASQSGESEELCGRRLRYEFFSSLADNAKTATAHNLNDCEETFIFNLARGTGLKGLTGIPAVRDNIIRPLIECTREEIEEYLSFYNITYVTDSTNLNDDYSRNRIRHNIIPVLEELNPSFGNSFKNCISALSETEDFISEEVNKAFNDTKCEEKFIISQITSLHSAVKNRLLIEIASYYGAYDISAKHISLLDDIMNYGGAVMLCGGVSIASDGIYLYKVQPVCVDKEINVPYSEHVNLYHFSGCTIYVTEVDKDDVKEYNSRQFFENSIADADKIKDTVFRSRREGDRFRYFGREHSKSLKNLFRENNITPEDRYGVPFLADNEHILWINDIGVSHYAVPDENTKNYVKITLVKG